MSLRGKIRCGAFIGNFPGLVQARWEIQPTESWPWLGLPTIPPPELRVLAVNPTLWRRGKLFGFKGFFSRRCPSTPNRKRGSDLVAEPRNFGKQLWLRLGKNWIRPGLVLS